MLFVACAVLLYALASAQERGYRLAVGRFGGTDQEIQECYFSVNRAMVILDPKGETCKVARELVGRTGMLVFVADESRK